MLQRFTEVSRRESHDTNEFGLKGQTCRLVQPSRRYAFQRGIFIITLCRWTHGHCDTNPRCTSIVCHASIHPGRIMVRHELVQMRIASPRVHMDNNMGEIVLDNLNLHAHQTVCLPVYPARMFMSRAESSNWHAYADQNWWLFWRKTIGNNIRLNNTKSSSSTRIICDMLSISSWFSHELPSCVNVDFHSLHESVTPEP